MFVLNFKKQFAAAVESGQKRQTIRALRKDGRRPQPGGDLRLYTGMRTTACRRLLDATCTEIAAVQIYEDGPTCAIVIGGQRLSLSEGVDLAKADGFDSRAEFLGFFTETHGLPFEGLMIRWEPSPPQRIAKGRDAALSRRVPLERRVGPRTENRK